MILDSKIQQKRFFNPKSKKDVDLYKNFVRTNSWGHSGCPFYLEFPYMTVPDMIKDKMIHHMFKLDFDRFHHHAGW
jgi:hypothetical protein